MGGATGAAGALFSEELGVVLQVKAEHAAAVHSVFVRHGLGDWTHAIGAATREMRVVVQAGDARIDESWEDLRRAWSETSWRMRERRDEPSCAREEFAAACDTGAPGLNVALTFDPNEDVSAPFIATARPKVAVLREQGVNSQIEMAAVFERVGFEPHDVHMSDVLAGRVKLDAFRGLVACGGFSYGDVLGAGEGWAKSILYHAGAREQFQRFLDRSDTFTLGVCNGCQMFAALKEIIPGAQDWPRFVRNRGEQFEGRFSLVELQPSPSIFLAGMDGSMLPIAVAHGEGRAEFASDEAAACVLGQQPGVGALHRRQPAGGHSLPRQSQRFAVRHCRDHQRRRPRDADHAAPGAIIPLRAEFLAAGWCWRIQRLVPHVRERAAMGGLNLERGQPPIPA